MENVDSSNKAESSSNKAENKDVDGKHMKMLALFIGIAGIVCGFVVIMFMFGLSCPHSAVVIGMIVAQGAMVALAHIAAMLALCLRKPLIFNAYFVLQACAIASFCALVLLIPRRNCEFRVFSRHVIVLTVALYLFGSFMCCRAVWLAKQFMKADQEPKPTVEIV